jgi:hypothetical protein
VVFYPVKNRGRRITTPAPDVEPTPAEVAEMRRLAAGWWVRRGRAPEDYANLNVTAECSCPQQGTDPACPLHGDVLLGTSEPDDPGESR